MTAGRKLNGQTNKLSQKLRSKIRKILGKQEPQVTLPQVPVPKTKTTTFPLLSEYTKKLLRRRFKPSFFEHLPYQKQIELLKRTEGIPAFNYDLAHKISAELNLPFIRVFHWLRAKRTKNIRAKENSRLTKEKSTLLKEEFKISSKLDTGRAVYLAHLLTLPVGVVQKWFNTKQKRIQKSKASQPPKSKPSEESSISDTSKTAEKNYAHFRTDQTLTLYEEFKRSSTISAKKKQALAKQTNLSTVQISCWFSKLRKKMDTLDMNTALTKISSLEPPQIVDLEKMYQMTPCISRDVARKLAGEMNLSKGDVAKWFSHRRLYELFKLRGKGGDIAPKFQSIVDMLDATNECKERQKVKPTARDKAPESSPLVNVAVKSESTKPKASFFDRLSQSNRLRLLKMCKNLDMNRVPKLAQELNVSELKLKTWLNFRMKNSKLIFSIDQSIMLEEEFGKKERLTKDEAIILAEKLGGNIAYGKLLTWWRNTRVKRRSISYLNQDTISDSEIKPTPVPEEPTNAILDESATENKFTPKTNKKKSNKLDKITNNRKRNSFRKPSRLTQPKIKLLRNEFEKDPELTDNRTWQLFQKLHVRMDTIRQWFKKEKEKRVKLNEKVKREPEEKTDTNLSSSTVPQVEEIINSPSPMKTHKQYAPKLPAQQEMLFEAFKESSHLSSERLTELSETLDLSSKQIKTYFSWMRKKLATISSETLLESYRNRNLTAEQVIALENEFSQHPYIGDESRQKLSKNLGVSKDTIKLWFTNRRYYEIVFNSNRIEESSQVDSDSDSTPLSSFIDSKNHIEFDSSSLADVKEKENNVDAGTEEKDTTDGEAGAVNDEPEISTNTTESRKIKVLEKWQKRILTQEFKRNPNISKLNARIMAHDLGLSAETVEYFFEKKREQKYKPTQGDVSTASDKSKRSTSLQLTDTEPEYSSSSKLSKEHEKNNFSEEQSKKVTYLEAGATSDKPGTSTIDNRRFRKKKGLTCLQRSILTKEFMRCNYISQFEARMLSLNAMLPVKAIEHFFEKKRQQKWRLMQRKKKIAKLNKDSDESE